MVENGDILDVLWRTSVMQIIVDDFNQITSGFRSGLKVGEWLAVAGYYRRPHICGTLEQSSLRAPL